MISVLKKRRDTEGESHGKTEAEMGGIESQPRNAGLQEAGRSQAGTSTGAFGEGAALLRP